MTWLLALDIDGTLAPIAETPSDARVPAEVLADLRKLAARPDVHLVFLTGRDGAAAYRLVPIPQATFAPEHGACIYAPGELKAWLDEGGKAPPLGPALLEWEKRCNPPEGALIERKTTSLALHTRRLQPGDATKALESAATLAESLGLAVLRGRGVVEVAERLASKRDALETIAASIQPQRLSYIGDDTTDIDALLWVQQQGGEAYFVLSPERPTSPHPDLATLATISEVWAWIGSHVQTSRAGPKISSC